MIFFIDPSIAGISGDMILSALIDLGGDVERFEKIVGAIKKKTRCKISIKQKKVKKNGVSALWLDIKSKGRYEDILAAFEGLPLDAKERAFVLRVAKTLAEAEAKVHGTSLRGIHLHELGSIDTVIDIAGTAVLARSIGMLDKDAEVYSSRVVVGSGVVKTEHGPLPVPAPAVAEILKNYKMPFSLSEEEGELATPTGVALLANLASKFERPPNMVIEAIGVGAGTFNLEMPNILRIVKGSSHSNLGQENVTVLETGLDDVTGEVLGYTLEKLYDEGALDVQIVSTVTKKNRPGYIVKVLCKGEKEAELAELLMKETGSLGVRTSTAHKRFYLNRETKTFEVKIAGYKDKVRVKIARDQKGNIFNLKPEYEDAKKIAKKTGMPLRVILKAIESQAGSYIEK